MRQFSAHPALVLAIVALLHALPLNGNALELAPCRIDAGPAIPTAKARCGEFDVAEDPANPDGTRIQLSVALVPALNVEPMPDPLVLFAGGPGQSAIESYLMLRRAFEAIRSERDILLVDQRGTGNSNKLACAIDEEDLATMDIDLETAVEQTRECRDALPGDPRFYTTSVAVDDLNAVREALGYEQLNLWGGSYGTRVALHYMRKYPQHTRSVMLDGVAPADFVLGPALAIDAQASLNDLFDRCAETPSCQNAFPDLRDQFSELTGRLATSPVTVTVAHPRTGIAAEQLLNESALAAVIRLSSYSPVMRSMVPLMIDEAANERYTMLASQALTLNEGFADMLAMGMHNAVVCSEDAPLFDDIADLDALQRTYMGDFQFRFLRESCAIWPKGIVDDQFKTPVSSDLPVLLLSGEYDPVTPPSNAEHAMATLSNALHVVAPSQGHIISSLGCVPKLLGEFVAETDVSELDTSCVDRLGPKPFFVSPLGPTP
ncbi:MAG: alpha/beta hydrolase [Pseudomonadota bacterium]